MPSLTTLLSWRTGFLLFALLNLKNFPFVWHLRLLYHFFRNFSRPPSRPFTHPTVRGPTHPLFAPVSIFSRSPLLETDYNLHKSNSTFFTDLDISRTALLAKVIVPGFKVGNAQLEKEGFKGRNSIMLGAVHTSFGREVSPYERYEVRSRILGWDRKWLVVGSWFIRPGKKGKGKDGDVVLASALSKYVVKKGRFTVPPERTVGWAGWLPQQPEKEEAPLRVDEATEESGILVPQAGDQTPENATSQESYLPDVSSIPSASGVIGAPFPSITKQPSSSPPHADPDASRVQNETEAQRPWDYARIDKERLRGLQIAEGWLALDAGLAQEYARPNS